MQEAYIIPQRKPAREIVYEYLKQAIIEKVILPQERIVETVYAEKFQISRTPVREALRMLEMDYLVEYIPSKGIVVRSLLSKEEIIEIFEIRKALEVAALKNMMNRIIDDELAQLSSLLSKGEVAYYEKDSVEFSKMANLFNAKLLGLSRMPKLITLLDQLNVYLAMVRHKNVTTAERQAEVLKEHRGILEAIKSKDAGRLEKVTILHLENSKKTYLKGYCSKSNK